MPDLKNLPPLPLRRLARVFALVAIAMAAGHLIQTLAARKSVAVASAVQNLPSNIVPLSAGTKDAPVVVFVRPVAPVDHFSAGTTMDRIRGTMAPVCKDVLALEARAGGMIGIYLTTGCRAAERVVLRHAGLAVTVRVGGDGRLQTGLPALAVSEPVEVLFQDGTRIAALVEVPEVANLRRFGVQWQGAAAFSVQGFEDGSDFGQPGVITAANPGTAETGVLTALGDATLENPLLAQIYTYPADPARTTTVVVEAAVTAQTCGHDLLGEVISSAEGRADAVDLTLAMPDCSGIGDFLLLKNLDAGLKIAAN